MHQEDSVADDEDDAIIRSPAKKKTSSTKRKGKGTLEVEGEEGGDEPLLKDEEDVDEDE